MAGAANRLKRSTEARQALARLMSQPGQLHVIHYSCESFYDRSDGRSPRITSIAVRHVGSRQTRSFSIHLIAERQHIPLDRMQDSYDQLEKEMLLEFYDFVHRNISSYWIHWNMRDINYGFLAIANRFIVLGGRPEAIPESHLFDLASKLIDIYGGSYAPHPRLQRLMELNHITNKDGLSGSEEAQAFERKEYVKLHQSTLRKVDVIHSIADREIDGKLRTNAKTRELLGTSIAAWVEWGTSTWGYKALGGVGIVFSVIRVIEWLRSFF